jgi:hypothetical protein
VSISVFGRILLLGAKFIKIYTWLIKEILSAEVAIDRPLTGAGTRRPAARIKAGQNRFSPYA